MTKISWTVTLTPLAVALAQTAKAAISGDTLTEQEIQLIGYVVLAFVGSGFLGVWKSKKPT